MARAGGKGGGGEQILLWGNHLIEIQNLLNGTNELIFQLNIRYTTRIVRTKIFRTIHNILRFLSQKKKEQNIAGFVPAGILRALKIKALH
jgi:hypothetical protein